MEEGGEGERRGAECHIVTHIDGVWCVRCNRENE